MRSLLANTKEISLSCILVACFHFIFIPSLCAFEAFSYTSSELQPVKDIKTSVQIAQEELDKWDRVAKELLVRFPLGDGDSTRLTAYLANAQKAFAEASKAISGKYAGTLDPISLFVLQLFFPNYQAKEAPQGESDQFSNELSTILANRIAARFNQEKTTIHSVSYSEGKDTWRGTVPFTGLRIPTIQPWNIDVKEYIAHPPPPPTDTAFWQDQLAQVKKMMAEASEKQKKEILYWAGMAGPGSGEWFEIAKQYMADKKTSLEEQLAVRSTLASSQMDTLITTFTSKYKYMVRRPDMLDPALKTYIKTPNHPSYPAGHSTCSASAATVLTYYFPENQKTWAKLAEECGLSRIRAGIHFPIDHQGGQTLGVKVGQAYTKQ